MLKQKSCAPGSSDIDLLIEPSPGDLVIGKKIGYHDYGTLGDSLVRDPTRNPVTHQNNPLFFASDDTLVSIAERVSRGLTLEKPIEGKPAPHIVSGIIVTGDVFVSSQKATRRLWQQLNAEATRIARIERLSVRYGRQPRIPFGDGSTSIVQSPWKFSPDSACCRAQGPHRRPVRREKGNYRS